MSRKQASAYTIQNPLQAKEKRSRLRKELYFSGYIKDFHESFTYITILNTIN